jgi:RND superfamily putative drug exporter
VLSLLGTRIDSIVVWKRSVHPPEIGFWSRLANTVMKRPVPFLVGTIALLLVLGSPFLGIRLGYLDYRVLPPSDPVRQVNDLVVSNFGQGQMSSLQVVVPRIVPPSGSAARTEQIDIYAAHLSELPNVGSVSAVTGVFSHGRKFPAPAAYLDQFAGADGTWLSVTPSGDPLSPSGQQIVQQVRDAPAPFAVLVGGMPAENHDSTQVILQRLPIALALIALVSFVVLFFMFNSILVPIKALVLNVLSLSATFGPMVWIFQEGHLSSLLGFTPTGSLLATMPLLMFCVAFGLSMDYEVFLISRIRELYDAGEDNRSAVAGGLQRTGRIITAAAITMSIVFLALATSGISFIKLFGIGLTLAVLIDAFIVRGMLVPAFMRLAGAANWWAPAFLRKKQDQLRT